MQIKTHLARLTRVHNLAYQRLFDAIDQLDDLSYRKDCGLYFRSVHETLNHLLLVDLLWFYRLKSETPPFDVSGLDQQLHSDRDSLKAEILITSEAIQNFVAGQREEFFEQSMRVKTLSGSEMFHQAYWMVATIVNHGTHHRGQITALLNQFDVDYAPLDLPFFPEM